MDRKRILIIHFQVYLLLNREGCGKRMVYKYEDFIKIIERLRAEDGCPWDREQTHESLRSCIMEEAAELLGAIRILNKTGSHENLKEELGDILLQVVMHSQIAKEEGYFTIDDVIQEVSEKMIRRHPHVFGQISVDSASKVLDNWDEIKRKEKQGKEWISSPLQEIPQELPSLTRAEKIHKKLIKLYDDSTSYQEAINNIKDCIDELEQKGEEVDKNSLELTIATMLWNITSISNQKRILSEQVLFDQIGRAHV